MVITFDIWPLRPEASGRTHIDRVEWDIFPVRVGSDPLRRPGLLIPQRAAPPAPPGLHRTPGFSPGSILHRETVWLPPASSQGCRAGDGVPHGENKEWPEP